MTVKVVVPQTRENTFTLTVEQPSGTSLAWTGVTRMVAGFSNDATVVADTDDDATLIDYSVTGELTFKLGDLGVDNGRHYLTVTAIDGSANETDVIHPDFQKVELNFVDSTTIP